MRSFEIFVVPSTVENVIRPGRLRREPGVRSVLDVFIRGANVTARLNEQRTPCVLRDLGAAVAELGQKRRGKAIVRMYDEPWEMCVERLGQSAALSVYRSGADPEIGVYDVRVPFSDVASGVRDAIDALQAPGPMAGELAAVSAMLARPMVQADDDALPAPVSVDCDERAPISVGAEFQLRSVDEEAHAGDVERTDLHALLFRGRLRAEVRGRAIDLGDAHPFLFAERFLELASRALTAWELGRSMVVRLAAGGVMVGVRLGMSGKLALSLGDGKAADYTFPALSVSDLAEAALAFARALIRAIVRRDRSQGSNLRLLALRRQIRETQAACREAAQKDSVINPAPESYRAYAEPARAPSVSDLAGAKRLRYSPRWRAIVPGIDLRATFLCGERLIVGGAAETFCLERSTGQPIWRIETRRATAVPTPAGLARIHADGEVRLHDLADGRTLLRTRLAPRATGTAAGVVVHAPTLPRLLVVTEGERHLVALDLASGEPRWRFAWGTGSLRVRRAGKLLYLASGDATLTALDVTTGEMVWRARDRLRFRGAPAIDHDTVFAVAGGSAGATHLHALCAFSGEIRWTASVPEGGRSCTVEGSPHVAGRAVIVVVRERQGVVLRAFDRESGAPLWATPAAVAPVGTSWLALGAIVVGNAPTGELVGLSAENGRTLYRHVLGRVLEADVPRRLDPILRSGALYVPHVDVHVLRPSDGAHLCTIGPCDAIPDLLRVDERCDVYVAEESGHLASFGAGPKLELVR